MAPNALGRLESLEDLLSQEASYVHRWLVRCGGVYWDGMGIFSTITNVVLVFFTGDAALALSSSLESK